MEFRAGAEKLAAMQSERIAPCTKARHECIASLAATLRSLEQFEANEESAADVDEQCGTDVVGTLKRARDKLQAHVDAESERLGI